MKWVADGARTRDSQNHNLELYRLSYGHHFPKRDAQCTKTLENCNPLIYSVSFPRKIGSKTG